MAFEERISDREEVERLLASPCPRTEAKIVRMYHLEGKSYSEISTQFRHARKQRRAHAQSSTYQDA